MPRRITSLPIALIFATIALGCLPSSVLAAKQAGAISPWPILKKMNSAMTKAKAAHGVGVSTTRSTHRYKNQTESWVDTGTFSGDAVTTESVSSQIREALTTKRQGTTSNATLDYATKGSKVATHVEGQSGKWHCGNANATLNTIDVWTPGTFGMGNTTKSSANKAGTKVWVAGSSTYKGAEVWKIETSSHKTDSKTKVSASATSSILVNKSSSLVPYYAWTLDQSGPGGSQKMSSSLTLSHFDEKLSVNMHGC